MSHPLVTQLHFARDEFQRCLDGVSPEDAAQRILPMNSISWIVGHLADQEHRYWVMAAQDKVVEPRLNDIVGHGKPASTPDLSEMWAAWRRVTQAADVFLDALTPDLLAEYPTYQGRKLKEPYGMLLLRNICHYWFHIGEAHAIRQQLGHPDLPQFVGDMSSVRF